MARTLHQQPPPSSSCWLSPPASSNRSSPACSRINCCIWYSKRCSSSQGLADAAQSLTLPRFSGQSVAAAAAAAAAGQASQTAWSRRLSFACFFSADHLPLAWRVGRAERPPTAPCLPARALNRHQRHCKTSCSYRRLGRHRSPSPPPPPATASRRRHWLRPAACKPSRARHEEAQGAAGVCSPPKRDKTEGTYYTVKGAIQRGVDFEVAAEAGAKSK